MANTELENIGKDAEKYIKVNTLGAVEQDINDLDFQEKLLKVCKPK